MLTRVFETVSQLQPTRRWSCPWGELALRKLRGVLTLANQDQDPHSLQQQARLTPRAAPSRDGQRIHHYDPTRVSLAETLVLVDTAGAGGMSLPTSTRISRIKRVQEHDLRVPPNPAPGLELLLGFPSLYPFNPRGGYR